MRLSTTWETLVRSLGQENPLEKEIATHSSILDRRIPWTEEPGRLQSSGSQRVGHNWVTSLFFPRGNYLKVFYIYSCCCLVVKSCLTLGNPMNCSPPGFSVHRISQARILEWLAISFSRGSVQFRDRSQVSRIAGRHCAIWATREENFSLLTWLRQEWYDWLEDGS